VTSTKLVGFFAVVYCLLTNTLVRFSTGCVAFISTQLKQLLSQVSFLCRCEIKEQSLNILLEVGPPMYLGFLIHVFLHFVIVQTKIGIRALADTDNSSQYWSARSSTISEYFEAEEDIVERA